MLIEIIFISCIFICGFAFGQIYALYKIHKFLIHLAIKSGIDLKKEISSVEDEDEEQTVSKFSTEIINDIIYLYNHDDKAFICQAKTIEELAKLSLEIKNVERAVVLHGKEIFIFHNGIAHKQ